MGTFKLFQEFQMVGKINMFHIVCFVLFCFSHLIAVFLLALTLALACPASSTSLKCCADT